jgi:hypothetical protein
LAISSPGRVTDRARAFLAGTRSKTTVTATLQGIRLEGSRSRQTPQRSAAAARRRAPVLGFFVIFSNEEPIGREFGNSDNAGVAIG